MYRCEGIREKKLVKKYVAHNKGCRVQENGKGKGCFLRGG